MSAGGEMALTGVKREQAWAVEGGVIE